MVFPSQELNGTDAAVCETFAVPRYLSLFGELALHMLVPLENGHLVHLGCRTGYPDIKLSRLLAGGRIHGVDPSPDALDLARTKARMGDRAGFEYSLAESLPLELTGGSFSHALCLCPILNAAGQRELFSEMHRLLCEGGQLLCALPLRGSCQELADLLREYALKTDQIELGKAVEAAQQARPSLETLSDQLEGLGFDDVDVELLHTSQSFESGRAFMEDPVARTLILPELITWLGLSEFDRPLAYVRHAIDKYWSEFPFQLSVVIGCASAHKASLEEASAQ